MLFAVVSLPFLVGELYPVLLAAFSPVFPESEILRAKVLVYTAPLWLHLPQTTALVLEELRGTLTSLLPFLNCWIQFFPGWATRVETGHLLRCRRRLPHPSAVTLFGSAKCNFRAKRRSRNPKLIHLGILMNH